MMYTESIHTDNAHNHNNTTTKVLATKITIESKEFNEFTTISVHCTCVSVCMYAAAIDFATKFL